MYYEIVPMDRSHIPQIAALEREEAECKSALSALGEKREQLLAVIGALRRFWKSSDIVIHTHSEYVAAGFTKGWLEKWVENDWKTGKGEPVSNRPEWEEMAELLNVHEFEFCVGKHTYSNVMAWWIRKVREGYLEIEDIIYGSRNGG